MINFIHRSIIIIILSFISIQILASESISSGDAITITNVKMPATPPVSRSVAIYFILNNNSEKDIKLTNVRTEIAQHAMIHQSREENGIAKMRHVDYLEICAGDQLEFSPGGYHIMLNGVDRKLLASPFYVTLEFTNHVPITFKVGI